MDGMGIVEGEGVVDMLACAEQGDEVCRGAEGL
jgi:hypothetical protein